MEGSESVGTVVGRGRWLVVGVAGAAVVVGAVVVVAGGMVVAVGRGSM